MAMPKRVGVTYREAEKVEPYKRALESVGIEPVLIHPGDSQPLDGLDGLLLTGGTDVNPKLYHQEPNAANDQPDDERDALEQQMLESALDRDLPVLAICRGMQLFNVVHGGTIEQHVEGHRQPGMAEAHPIGVDAGTRLAEAIGPGTHVVNSRHHQVVDRTGRGLHISAKSEDGYPEALEREDKKFAVAVQWHPEDLIENREDAKRLFQAFADSL
jgi:putative glutamine amidotransferase